MTKMYEEIIKKIDLTVNPIGVEMNMRLEYGTLDTLSKAVFKKEIKLAKQMEAYDPGFLRRNAEIYGGLVDFDRWETENGPTSFEVIWSKKLSPAKDRYETRMVGKDGQELRILVSRQRNGSTWTVELKPSGNRRIFQDGRAVGEVLAEVVQGLRDTQLK